MDVGIHANPALIGVYDAPDGVPDEVDDDEWRMADARIDGWGGGDDMDTWTWKMPRRSRRRR